MSKYQTSLNLYKNVYIEEDFSPLIIVRPYR